MKIIINSVKYLLVKKRQQQIDRKELNTRFTYFKLNCFCNSKPQKVNLNKLEKRASLAQSFAIAPGKNQLQKHCKMSLTNESKNFVTRSNNMSIVKIMSIIEQNVV